ncbi:hypothetical protein F5J12DRAFT_266755 [Pisolithus orientalis]|uniref:uncharacterized protein n=1 Tax=Pisolithus orientalis TaxID=936130 RepID=UPI0022240656|nr:uncharacterized protein F5J12DRAFT_266755 [Pisolithus orientalis]KAI5999751.1 hypothetical protein F5J12DRAFT_266755 [Pisolithus orientalis]
MSNIIKADAEVVISSSPHGPRGQPLRWLFPRPVLPVLPVNLIARNPDIQAPRVRIITNIRRTLIHVLCTVRPQEGRRRHIHYLPSMGCKSSRRTGRYLLLMEGRAQEWVIRYREFQNGYTIVKRLDEPGEIGWIAPTDGSSQIRVGRLREIPTAPPGQYRPEELYNLAFPLE